MNLFLKEDVNESLQEIIRTNVLTATRNFHHRVEAFKKEILYGEDNSIKIEDISYRIEFQGRGAAHIHGTLWLDIEKIEEIIINEDLTGTLKPGCLTNAFIKLRQDSKLSNLEKTTFQRFVLDFLMEWCFSL